MVALVMRLVVGSCRVDEEQLVRPQGTTVDRDDRVVREALRELPDDAHGEAIQASSARQHREPKASSK